jgi:hypothetical protein
VSAEEDNILHQLKPVRPGYVPPCLDGTRKTVLAMISDWMNDSNTPNIFWLKGNPGAGKTAISSSIVSTLRGNDRFISSFFFKAGDASLGDASSLWRTVAFDFAKANPAFKNAIVPVLRESKTGLERVDIELHFRSFIEGPLQKTCEHFHSDSVIVVVDALDECGDADSTQRKILLRTLKNWSRLSPKFKIFVTSRPEHDINYCLSDISQQAILHTGDLVESESSHDISLFFHSRFTELRMRDFPSLSSTWPGKVMVDALTNRAAGLFIWVETVTKFVEEGDPIEQLDLILGGRDEGANIDDLYRKILNGRVKDNMLEAFKIVVGSIVLAKTPLSRDSLKALIRDIVKETSVDLILNKLSSVISGNGPDKILRTSHQSFADFLLDMEQCSKSFHIDRTRHDLRLAKCCLKLMNEKLKFNICGLETSYLRNDEIPDLAHRIEKAIPPHLSYACLFWDQHLREDGFREDGVESALEELKRFLEDRLLFWLEVLSLMKEVWTAECGLDCAASWIEVCNSLVSFQITKQTHK